MVDFGDPDEIHRQVKKLGPRQKKWEELGPQQRRSVTQGLYDDMKKVAVCRGVDPVKLAGSLLHRLEHLMNLLSRHISHKSCIGTS